MKETKLAKYEYLPGEKTLHWEWKETTKEANWEEFQQAMLEYAALAEKYKAKSHIVNEKNQHLTLVPEYQLWIDSNISVRTVVSGCQRIAIIKHDDFFEEVAVKQLFEEENTSALELALFNTFEEAFKWVSSFSE